MSTFIYECIPFRLPILYPSTTFNLIDDIVDEKLAIKIEISDIKNICQIVNDFQYRGENSKFYFSDNQLKDILRNELKI